ncbi:MAG: inorganic diphosphatase [Clostridia bacterium]
MVSSKEYLGKDVEVLVDRKLGTRNHNYNFIYPLNYGYIANTISGDGNELDAYVLGEYVPLEEVKGMCIALIHRKDDCDDKLVVTTDGRSYTDDQIKALTQFQERFHDIEIWRL